MSEVKRPENLSFKNAPIELKEDGDKRYIEAVFSLFDTIDSDNDVTKANALRSGYTGNKVPLVWNHDWSKVIGRGIIETDNQKAVFKGYFLNTEAGKEAYNTVKEMQDMQQFSYGFQVMKSSKGTHIDSKGEEVPVRVLEDVKVWEVSPVLVGAQQNSFVQALKSGLEPVDEEIKAEMQVESTEPEVSSETDASISKSSQQGMRLGEHAVASLEELKAFTERIEDLASLRNSEKKTLSSKSTELVAKYLQGVSSIYNGWMMLLQVMAMILLKMMSYSYKFKRT